MIYPKWKDLSGIDSILEAGIIRELYFEKELSCQDLSHLLGKSVPIVTKGVNELIASKWVKESGLAPSSGGRRPMLYSLKKDNRYIVVVSLSRLGMDISILDIQNNPVADTQYFNLNLKDADNALPFFIQTVKDLVSQYELEASHIIGVGISMPGFFDVNKGVNYSYWELPNGDSLRDYLSEKWDLPVYIDNDSSLLALAELRFGIAKNRREVMVINIGWGVGLGMIVNGDLFRGFSGFAGELSHIPISDSDKLCTCGKKGCLEVEATLLVATENALEGIASGTIKTLEAKDNVHEMSNYLMDAANAGNQEAIALFADMGYKIGKALAILIHIQNPEMIVLSGRGAKIGRLLLAPIQQALNKYCIPRLFENTKLKVSQLDGNIALIGAGALVMDNFGEKRKHKSHF